MGAPETFQKQDPVSAKKKNSNKNTKCRSEIHKTMRKHFQIGKG
jgi:hypothetical protein